MNSRIKLLDVGDGPEGICIYTSEDDGVVDWSQTFPATYINVSLNGARVTLGPFTMPSIYRQLRAALHCREEDFPRE